MSVPAPDGTAEFFDRIEAAVAQVDVRPDGVFATREAFSQFLRQEIRQFVAARQQAPSLDPVFGLPAGDAPGAAATPPARRPARPRPGPVTAAVTRDLKTLPDALRKGAIAASMLQLARDMDTGQVASKDAPAVARELRLAWAQLEASKPVGGTGDKTDEVTARREGRLERLQRARAAGGE